MNLPPASAEANDLADKLDSMRRVALPQQPPGFYERTLEWLHHPEPLVRQEATRYLARHCQQTSDVQALETMVVSDGHPAVRKAAADCLGGVFRATRNRNVNELLATVARNPDEHAQVRSAAYAAIKRINGY